MRRGAATVRELPQVIKTDEIIELETRVHYHVVVLREDQLDRIADAVVRKLRQPSE